MTYCHVPTYLYQPYHSETYIIFIKQQISNIKARNYMHIYTTIIYSCDPTLKCNILNLYYIRINTILYYEIFGSTK
jgi:hypothetical protein